MRLYAILFPPVRDRELSKGADVPFLNDHIPTKFKTY
jgi:hypothetical protein